MYAIAKTDDHQINTDLTLHDSCQSPLTVRAIALTLTKQNNELIVCRLTFQVNPQLYQRIDTTALFNLKPAVRNPLSSDKFLREPDITIETSLKPDLLPLLAEHAVNIDATAKYILNLSQEQPDNQILSTESWLGLSVKQQQESGEIGYRTFWSYISPEKLAQTSTNGEGIAEGIVNFFKDWTEANLSVKTQKASAKMLERIDKFLTEFADINQDEITQKIEADLPSDSTDGSIFEEIINFFQADDWPFVQLPGQPALQILFQGENGKWNCYARARSEQNQFVFYSICPVNSPENKRLAVAEFLTRANSGMMIGNFELDFTDGEISYKTSIDVEGDRLSFALIQRVVYANVTMMDEYLPGIMSVIYGNVSPEEAIAKIER
ncbi:MAG: YbjN domain-containing protein [Nostoc sp. DedQUE08]|uniref:YbjN domain-containing protein n=1 Tax=unclassified Nostoc TaxID=2593658 RepID=UPI002AD318B1|nr:MULTISPECIES: YbjN domain-containing protein [unclassified Nostoc]MDZ8065578.1 YbjN domain-containing protein [Nostoc sp. DedQUE08]MDZ8091404.1 YbjN domain-containing protein [Nostoc sp. DedQUE05]